MERKQKQFETTKRFNEHMAKKRQSEFDKKFKKAQKKHSDFDFEKEVQKTRSKYDKEFEKRVKNLKTKKLYTKPITIKKI